jgi:hypothetical protein
MYYILKIIDLKYNIGPSICFLAVSLGIYKKLYYILVYLKQIDQVLQQQIKLVKISYFSLGA